MTNTRSVTLANFARAETHLFMSRRVERGMFGLIHHMRERLTAENQVVVRANFDTMFSYGVFDLTTPVTITKPDTGNRYQSMSVINEDHHIKQFVYVPGDYELTRENVGSRYVHVAFRTLADQSDPADFAEVHKIQDQISFAQESPGVFEVDNWDDTSQEIVRGHLEGLARHMGRLGPMFGDAGEVDPVSHLIGTAVGWGGLPREHVVYWSVFAEDNGGTAAYELVMADVPCDEFWSVTVYNSEGYVDAKPSGIHSFNSLTAEREADGSVRIRFGGDGSLPNSFPISDGWNYTVRLYRPHQSAVEGTWAPPSLRDL